MIKTFVQHRNAANLLMFIIVIAGLLALARMNIQFFPTVDTNTINIFLTWTGASASDIESAVLQRIEPELRNLNSIDKITSEASEGEGLISIDFVEGTEMQIALSEVEAAVGRIQNLPEELEEPLIQTFIFYEEISRILISGPFSEIVLANIAQDIRNDLIRLGIDRVTFAGRRDPEIRIEIDEHILRQYDLTLQDIASRIRMMALDQPLGNFGSNVLVQARIDTPLEYAKSLSDVLIIPDRTGKGILLDQIATISNDVDRTQEEVFVNEKRGIELIIERIPATHVLKASRIVTDYLQEKKDTWPKTLSVQIYDVNAEYVSDRINMLLRNALSGLIIVLLLLYIFLGGYLTFWIGVSIPIALCGTAAVMFVMGQSINMLSLFALIMMIGLVVDDSIVVGEHTAFLAERGFSPMQAAYEGVLRMMVPVTASALTTCATFLPISVVGGIIGQIIGAIPLVVVAALAASLIECFLILPAHLRMSISQNIHRKPHKLRQHFDHAFDTFRHGLFKRMVQTCIEWRYTVMTASFVALFLSFALLLTGRVDFSFFESPETDVIIAKASFRPGTPRSRTLEQILEMTRAVKQAEFELTGGKAPLVYTVVARINEDYAGEIQLELIPSDQRNVRTVEFIQEWDRAIERLPGLEILTLSERQGGPPGQDIDIRLSNGTPEVLKQAAEEIKRLIASYQGVFAIEDDLIQGKQESLLSLTPLGKALGFTLDGVAQQLRAALDGIIVDRFARGEDEVTLRLLLSETDQQNDILSRLRILSSNGGEALLSDIVTLEQKTSFLVIRRENSVREVTITANVNSSISNANEIRLSLPGAGLDQIVQKFNVSYRFSGRAEEQKDTLTDMLFGSFLALGSMYIILAWTFASYSRPIIVMSIIPFGLMGAFFGHYILGYTMTIISLIGILGLSGIIINDSVILITTINRSLENQKNFQQAIVDATLERLRPIILTSITTIGGLLPLLFETSLQARFIVPMVITLVFGLSTTSFLVLIVVPSLLMIQHDVRHFFSALLSKDKSVVSSLHHSPTRK